ncbi:MAG: serine protease [Candidatus Kapabacteria bacterium]|nr:serine protease [Candidatus Kapabacteria bacterium]
MVRPPAVQHVLSIPARLDASVTATGAGIGIAMIDSDFIVHPDIVQPSSRIRRYVDATTGTESAMPPSEPSARHWHGTMTACTAAGNGYLSNGMYTSLAPEAHLVLIRTMHENGRIPTETIVRALDWLKDHAREYQVRVVNISVYADEIDQSTAHPVTQRVEQLTAMGIVVVAAAGNNSSAAIRPPASAPSAITVGGLDDNNSLFVDEARLYDSTFGITALGIQKPDVIAPAIWLAAPLLPDTPEQRQAAALCALDAVDDAMLTSCATALAEHTSLPNDIGDAADLREAVTKAIRASSIVSPHYKMVDGTSFAAPIVASIAAQLLSIDPSLSPVDVKHILMSTARPLSGHAHTRQGSGVVQQTEAVDIVVAGCGLPAVPCDVAS